LSCPRKRASSNPGLYDLTSIRGLLDRPVKPGDDEINDRAYIAPNAQLR
jgi:hypothetical protein